MFNIFFLQKITPPYWTPALEEFLILFKEGFLDVTLQHGWEFTHHFSEQNSYFLRKNERMSDSLNKMSDLLIFGEWHKQIAYDRSFLGATWEICSQSLFCHEWPEHEQLAHIALSKRGNERISSFFITIFLSTKLFWLYSNFFEWIGGIAHFLWGKERPERISEFQSEFGFPWKLPLSSTARWRSTTWMLLPWPQSFLSLWTVSHWWRSRSRNQIIQKVCFLLVITVGKLSSVSFGYCTVCTVNKM